MSDLAPLLRDMRRDFRTITDELSVTLSAARGTVTGIDAEAGRLTDRLTVAIDRIGGTAGQLAALVGEARPGLRAFSNSGLYALTQFLTEARAPISRAPWRERVMTVR